MPKYYYWIVAKDESGKSYLLFGSDKSEEDARQQGLEILGGADFEIKRYNTSSIQTASSIIHGNRLKETHSLKDASRRIGHSRSIERMKRRGNL